MLGHIRRDLDTGNMPEATNYMDLTEHSSLMRAHIALMVIAWVFVLPLVVVFSISGHRFAPVMRWMFLCLCGVGVVFARSFTAKTADLYEHNAHHTLGWVAILIVLSQAIIDVVLRVGKRQSPYRLVTAAGSKPTLFLTFDAIRQGIRRGWNGSRDRTHEAPSPDTDSGCRVSFDDPPDFHDRPESSQSDACDDYPHAAEEADEAGEYKNLMSGRRRLRSNFLMHQRLSDRLSALNSSLFPKVLGILVNIIDRTILLVGYTALLTGFVTYAGIFRGNHIFNGLAHFIKGSIFFWYGLLTLGRWVGNFAIVGWAWNVKPSGTSRLVASCPSAEFVESFVIFLYGFSNMFLEHLAGWGQAWTASDLEHVSISILFFGGGLCGMLVESHKIRDLLNTTIVKYSAATETTQFDNASTEAQQHLRTVSSSTSPPRTSTTSLNTLPALIIFLLGLTMSSHHQKSHLSTQIHFQWGMLLCSFSLMRLLTYITMYLSPPTSIFPSRPPTELLASFCLIAGGIVFMASTQDLVAWVEREGVMSGLVFTVAMAGAAFVMAWVVVVLGARGWAEGAVRTSRLGREG